MCNVRFELFREWLLVQQDPGVPIFSVEAVLHLPDAFDHTFEIVVPT